MSVTGSTSTRPVLIDTDVFSKVFVGPSANPHRQRWSAALAGRTVTIAVQTEVELRAWPEMRGWAERRTAALLTQITSLGTIQVTAEVQTNFVFPDCLGEGERSSVVRQGPHRRPLDCRHRPRARLGAGRGRWHLRQRGAPTTLCRDPLTASAVEVDVTFRRGSWRGKATQPLRSEHRRPV